MTNWESLVFYLLSFSLSAVLVYLGSLPRLAGLSIPLFGKKRINIVTTLGLAVPILIGGFVYNVGIDYEGYVNLFNLSNSLDYDAFVAYNGSWTVEPTFYAIARMSMFLSGSSWPMFMTYATINIVFFYLFLRKVIPEKRGLGFFIYLTVFFLFTMTLMRQGAAIAICFYALAFLLNKRYLTYVVLVAIASLVHFSALFFVIPGLLYIFARNRRFAGVLFISVVTIGLLVVLSPVLIQVATSFPPFDKYAYLLNKERTEVFIGYTFLLQLCIAILLVSFYGKVIKKFTSAILLYAMLLVGLVAYSLNFRIDYASRLSYYFLPVSTVLIPYLLVVFSNSRLVYALIVMGCIAYFFQVYYIGNSIMVFPYNSIWSGVI